MEMSKYKIPEIYYNYPKCGEEEYRQKKQALNELMVKLSLTPIREKSWEKAEYMACLNENGVFTDLQNQPDDWFDAIRRLRVCVMEDYHYTKGEDLPFKIPENILKSIVFYCKQEIERGHRGPKRFHKSVFALPTCAFNMFLAMLPVMMQVEDDTCTCSLWQAVYKVLNDVMLQAWTLPLRGDETDDTPISLARFQNHVWWVGGNGISYRPVFYVAVCFRDVRMLDVLLEVVQCATASKASQREPSFWQEGICADGFGWGHGAQTYNNGYPSDSISSALKIMKYVMGTPWDKALQSMDWDNFIHYIRGISWSSYDGSMSPMMSRHCFELAEESSGVRNSEFRMIGLAQQLIEFEEFLSKPQAQELKDLLQKGAVHMQDSQNSYVGTRYFFNNDSLISKNKDRYFYFNMSSARCKGAECADNMADTRNFYVCDGSYIVLADKTAYLKARGTWNVCHLPGVTERDLTKDEIMSEVNWSGYNSIFDFAAGIGYDKNGVAGFIYQKSDYREPDGAGVVRDKYTKEIMGVCAYKSAFVYNDTFVLLGAGITDFKPEFGKNVVTTIDNTKGVNSIVIDKMGNKIEDLSKIEDNKGAVYVKNNGLTYGVNSCKNTSVYVCAENRMTDWVYLNKRNIGEKNQSVPVFEMSINHGTNPIDSEYAYWICADKNKTPSQINAMYNVIENNKKLQAVNFEDKLISAIFYQAGAFSIGESEISVSAPCALMLEKLQGDRYKLSLADAKQDVDLKYITVSIGTEKSLAKEIKIEMPTGNMIGKQISVNILI